MYFMHYLCVLIILSNMDLYKYAAPHPPIFFGKLDPPLSAFFVVLCLYCILNFDVILINFITYI